MSKFEIMENTAENTAMQMIEITEMETNMKAKTETDTERGTERILLMATETIEVRIEAPTSPVNKEGDN